MIRTLVLYESRYGSTREAARIISLILGPSSCIPVSQFTEKHRDYDFIIMGAPIYMGKLHSKLQDFIDREKEWLSGKNTVLFCTCLDGSEGLQVLREVESDLGGQVMELGVLGGRLEMDRLTEEDFKILKKYLSQVGLPPQGMDLFSPDEVVDLALRFLDIRDTLLERLPVEKLKEEVENFLKEHNTCTLATSSPGRVRATPLEYHYCQGHLYILSEGGVKFANLLSSSRVSVTVYDEYKDMESLKGMQISGQALVIEDVAEYQQVVESMGLEMESIRSLPVDLQLIRVDMEKVEFLNSQFEKDGYSIRQVLNF
ncbi:pyridoxamine 5'-phosphate oxidase-like FMN-binding protein [Methanobacterium sp. MB1]|jgi:menaquinone-dependent protoporphyrinogen IX oxidase/uncharacterized protein YhbP (UPF0306 family)|uniref:flavodoxin domain-containing protein n=1 Tax=Methanobacterium sp. TaxID=2164 RepID=UPI0003C9851A|nr:flavodoxin domain-containing protein [uncultured Methanobacterium sp.]CDG64855.1 pyridoxamine 5'-phosphate oxidase-like FMN-binding protein [Methanobacterium sp. MB1]